MALAIRYRPAVERLEDFRSVYAQMVVARGGCPDDVRLGEAFSSVPRHLFVGPGPWAVAENGSCTGSADAALVYQDVGLGLAPGIPTGLPSLHASLLHAANVQPGERVMHVGAGAGYYTAILAELVGPSGRVYAFEIDKGLAARARSSLDAWPWASVESRSGLTKPDEPLDVVYVNASVQQLPRPWIEALSARGRLVFPLVPHDRSGAVFLVRHGENGVYPVQFVSRARFVPCIGAEDGTASARLSDAFQSDACERVTSLRFLPNAPDETAWYIGDGWWFSVAGSSKASAKA